jgi:hypothetical protein
VKLAEEKTKAKILYWSIASIVVAGISAGTNFLIKKFGG